MIDNLDAIVTQWEKRFLDARLSDSTVRNALERRFSPAAIAAILVQEKRDLLKRIAELEAIAPRKFKIGDKVVVWHCSDDLIPLVEIKV